MTIPAMQTAPALAKTLSVSAAPPDSRCSNQPKAGAAKALIVNTRKLIAPVALPFTSSGLTSLMIE